MTDSLHIPATTPGASSTASAAPEGAIRVDSLDVLRRRGTLKWTTYDEDVLPLWVAESDFDTCPAVKRAIDAAVERQYFGYEKRDGAVQKALAGFLESQFGWSIDSSWVRLVPDVVKGVAVAIDELTPAGSTIILPTPSYHPFFLLSDAVKRPTVTVSMTRVPHPDGDAAGADTQWGFDFDALEAAFAATDNPAGVGAMIVCNPYNPLGRAFSADELHTLVALAAKYNVRLISDEIHAPIVFDGRTHIPLASISEEAARLTVTVLATSKGWNTAGLHCAQMIFTNPADRALMAKVTALRTGEASTLGQVAAEAAYREGTAWLANERAYLESNLDLLATALPEALPGAKFERPEATFLLWVDVSQVPGLDTNPAAKILANARVAVNEGTMFGPEGAGHIRLNFATSREILEQAMAQIAGASYTS